MFSENFGLHILFIFFFFCMMMPSIYIENKYRKKSKNSKVGNVTDTGKIVETKTFAKNLVKWPPKWQNVL